MGETPITPEMGETKAEVEEALEVLEAASRDARGPSSGFNYKYKFVNL